MAKQGKQKGLCGDTKQENQNVSCSDMMNTIDAELSKIVESDELKLELSKFLKGMILDDRRRALGLNLGPRKLPHFAFLGESGTGKSMIAGMLGKLLHMTGILPKDKVTEVEFQDLAKLNQSVWLKIAAGGILLVNDCVTTSFKDKGEYWFDYSTVVADMEKTIIPFMDSGKVVVIIAGYPEELEFLISKYDQLRNRFSNIFEFESYDSDDLVEILELKVSDKDENSPFRGFKLHSSCTIDALCKQIDVVRHTLGSRKNGHIVDEMLKKAKENLDSRIDVESTDPDVWVTFTINDFVAAARALSENFLSD